MRLVKRAIYYACWLGYPFLLIVFVICVIQEWASRD